MSFTVSPGVNVSEIDLTTGVPTISTTIGALAGVFRWGPVFQRFSVDSETYLNTSFGSPTNFNPETWFTASSFLSYGNQLIVVRVANTTSNDSNVCVFSAYTNTAPISSDAHTLIIKNAADYETKEGDIDQNVQYIAKYPGALGNGLRIAVCDSANQYSSNVNLQPNGLYSNTSLFTLNVSSNVATVSIGFTGSGDIGAANTLATNLINSITIGDNISVGNTTIGTQYLVVSGISTTPTVNSTTATVTINFTSRYRLSTNYTSNTISRAWEFHGLVNGAPTQTPYVSQMGNTAANDELHAVVVDNTGAFTGVPGTVLETFQGLSRATDAQNDDGTVNYYKTVINNTSAYLWFANDRSGAASAPAASIASSTNTKPLNGFLSGGTDGLGEGSVDVGTVLSGYDLFASPEDVDVSLILQGKAIGGTYGEQIGNYILDNICDIRLDCVAFISPPNAAVVNASGSEVSNITAFRNLTVSNSYGFMDSGYKYMYDKYNDVYRWIPLNGDMAGLAVRTDTTNDPWWSFAGLNRGQVKNVVKLAFNPRQSQRDSLYQINVNSVVTFPGQGTVLYGDKTMQTKSSAFDRINVRRLFIVLEKQIATAAKYSLFEFNDAFTQAQFKNLVNPYLRDVQGRRGITDFVVVCDATNNTPQVVDANEFVRRYLH